MKKKIGTRLVRAKEASIYQGRAATNVAQRNEDLGAGGKGALGRKESCPKVGKASASKLGSAVPGAQGNTEKHKTRS